MNPPFSEGLDKEVQKEIRSLRNFEVQPSPVSGQVEGQVTLSARIRRVPLWIQLDPSTYPARPPEIFLAEGWSWGEISAFERERRIDGLSTQARWNRTLGLATLLRDLEIVFSQESPVHHQPSVVRRQVWRLGEGGRRVVGFFTLRLGRIRQWVRGKFTKPTPVIRIRSDYQRLIEEKALRIERFREALATLEGQWEKRKTKALQRRVDERRRLLEEQVRELEDLREEAREMEAELALTQIEQEILDARSGVDPSNLSGQREEMLRSVRDERAKLRVSKRLAKVTRDGAQEDEDAEYLERGQQAARRVMAPREFEALASDLAERENG